MKAIYEIPAYRPKSEYNWEAELIPNRLAEFARNGVFTGSKLIDTVKAQLNALIP